MNSSFSAKTDREKGIFSLILLALVFASMGLFARYLATGFLLFEQVYLRMFAALAIGLIVFRNQLDFSKLKKLSIKDWSVITLRAVSFSLFGIVLFTEAIILTKYSNVSFIGALPMTAVLGFVLIGEKFTWKKFFYVLLAFLGVFLIAVKDYNHLFSWGKGELFALIASVFFALSYIARKWQSDLLNNKELTVINFLVAFLAVFIVSLAKGDGLPLTGWNWELLLAVVGAGTFNIMNVYLTNYGFQKVEAVVANNILSLETLFAIVLGFFFYKETPMLKEFIGGAIIAISVLGTNKLES